MTVTIERVFPWFATRIRRRWIPVASGIIVVSLLAIVGTAFYFATRAKPQNAVILVAPTVRPHTTPAAVVGSASASDSVTPEAVEPAVAKALASLDSGDAKGAVLALESLAQANPQSPIVLHALSLAYRKSNRLIDALAAAKNWAESLGDPRREARLRHPRAVRRSRRDKRHRQMSVRSARENAIHRRPDIVSIGVWRSQAGSIDRDDPRRRADC